MKSIHYIYLDMNAYTNSLRQKKLIKMSYSLCLPLMMVYSMFFYVTILAYLLSNCYGAPNITIPTGVFAFGDSIVDQGNNNELTSIMKCNFPPYGRDLPNKVPTGRFSNGKTPPDLIAEALGIQELIPAYLDPNLDSYNLTNGVSFASGGTGYDPLTPKLVSVTPLSDQLKQFKKYIKKLKQVVGKKPAKNALRNNLYIVVAGSNDIANTYFTFGVRRLQYDAPSYADLLVSSASTFIQELYKLGARKIGVLGVPPVGCLPFQRTVAGGIKRKCAEERNEAAKVVNSKLSSTLDSLTKTLQGSRVVYVDVYSSLLDLIQKPHEFGFEVSDKGCCGTFTVEVAKACNRLSATCEDDSKYVFWDSYHPTEKAYKFLVDRIIKNYYDKFV